MHEFNKARQQAIRNSMIDEESYFLTNRTLSMPNIYGAQSNILSSSPPSRLSTFRANTNVQPEANAPPADSIECSSVNNEVTASCPTLYPSIEK